MTAAQATHVGRVLRLLPEAQGTAGGGAARSSVDDQFLSRARGAARLVGTLME